MADKQKANVVFVTSVFDDAHTGPATFARYLYAYFNGHEGVNFYVVAPSVRNLTGLYSVAPRTGPLAAQVYSDLQRRALEITSGLPANTVIHVNNTFTMGRLARHKGATALQVNDYDLARFGRTLRRKTRARDLRGAATLTARHIAERRAIRRATLAICNSEATAAEVRHAYRPPPEKVRVIHKAVDTIVFRPPLVLPPPPHWPGETAATRLVFVGSDWHRKGLDLLLQAMTQLRETLPAQLVVVGQAAAPAARRFVSLAARLGLAREVRFLGRLTHADILPWLWSAHLAVLPSRDEALGVAALEAMAAGLPVVASDIGGLREIVSAENGVLVPPEDPAALASAITMLVVNEAMRDRCRAGAIRTAERFRVEAMCSQYEQLYHELSGDVP